ncbi:hypothetical protein [Enterovirga aerilata]|uniref:Uncharacterized protein n=1 Tax=Enterovirga aerilata TaxID=2730920 RepID=A0A849IE13_9HYPH|nr:hypothetical protein [Enterovirga sp. DB1703]NNM74270.1 hypothetical protein [Enterovirga sp. DB1703]
MSDSLTARSDVPGAPPRPTEPEIIVPAPTPTSAPSQNGSPAAGAAVPTAAPVPAEPLARIEDKTSRIEEKLARSEDALQRVVGRFELATNRMNEVATRAELTAMHGEVSFIARRVRKVPGWTALVGSSVLTAILTAVVVILLLRYFPGALAR